MRSLTILKHYLGKSDTGFTFRRVIALLLQGMAVHAVEGDSEDYDNFRKDFQRIQTIATQHASAKELLVAAGAANQALANYEYRTTRFIRQQGAVLQNMISMLTQTMISIGAGSDRSAEYLQEIERELAGAAAIEDVQQVKLRLGACLENIRNEAARQKTYIESNASQIRKQVERAQICIRETLPLADQIDLITGLPMQSAAKAAFDQSLESSGPKYVAIFVLNRIESINSRFGRAIGDLLLKEFLESLSPNLQSTDRLFRWSGSAIAALLEREQTIDVVRAEVGRISPNMSNKILDIEGRPVLLPVTISWFVIPLSNPVAEISESVETFVAKHTQNKSDS